MTTCVPDMHLHLLVSAGSRTSRILYTDNFLQVGTTDRDVVHFVKSVLTEPQSDR